MPSLPREDLVKRVRAEIENARRASGHHVSVPDSFDEFPLTLDVALLNTPGPMWDGKEVRHQFIHKLTLTLTEEYPYVKPRVAWKTPLFHPNVMLPDEGGHACTRLLDGWRFDSSLTHYLELLAYLVGHPDVEHPYTTPATSAAAQYFSKAPYKPPTSALTREVPAKS